MNSVFFGPCSTSTLMQSTTVLALVLRVFISLATQSFFQPDEYFQSLEPAHHLVFGYGYLTWEWLAPKPIRSILYPLINVPTFWILRVTGLDGTLLLIIGPKIIHGILAALTDIWTMKLASTSVGKQYASTAYFLSLMSFFNILALSRSLSNSLETSLTTVALAYYPWNNELNRSRIRKMLVFAALACSIRVTNAVIWICMIIMLLWNLRRYPKLLRGVLLDILLVGTVSLSSLFALDSLYYGKPTLTPLNFVLTNMSPVSLFYGASPWHYYITQALPILCTTALPFVLHGARLSLRAHPLGQDSSHNKKSCNSVSHSTPQRVILVCIFWTISVYSIAGHKEWRFIHPLLPLLHILAATSLVKTFPPASPSLWLPPVQRRIIAFLLLSLPASLYVMFIFGSAQISVMHFLRSLDQQEVSSIGFLMPCHSTPWQAYLHNPALSSSGRMWALGCEPPLGLSPDEAAHYHDQTDVFFQDPIEYLSIRFPAVVNPEFPPSRLPMSPPGQGVEIRDWDHEWPQYIVLFTHLIEIDGVKELLLQKGYGEIWKDGWAWEGEGKRKGGVRVWKYLSP